MALNLTEIYQAAESDLLAGNLDQALKAYMTVIKAEPEHVMSRFRIAEAFEKRKEINRAFDVYKQLAWHCIKAGYPLMGLVASKRAAHLQTGSEDTLSTLADLYSMESDRVDQETEPFDLPSLPDAEIEEETFEGEHLSAAAEKLAQDFGELHYPKQLPAIPLFSMLTMEAFFPILEILQVHTYKPGEIIIKQGDPCTCVYMLAHGEIEVTEEKDGEEKVLAHLNAGSVFGEMALISEAPRVASARAIRESNVLVLSRDELETAAEDLDDITWAMAKFVRKRFINNLLLTSPVFQPFNQEERKEILERFTSVGVPTDEVIIQEGTTGPGLYLILGGEVEISKFEGDTSVHLTRMAEGSVFGEISLINDSPTTATVQAVRGGEFLFLSKEDYQELVKERPEIQENLAKLSEERMNEQRQSMENAGMSSADGLVII